MIFRREQWGAVTSCRCPATVSGYRDVPACLISDRSTTKDWYTSHVRLGLAIFEPLLHRSEHAQFSFSSRIEAQLAVVKNAAGAGNDRADHLGNQRTFKTQHHLRWQPPVNRNREVLPETMAGPERSCVGKRCALLLVT